MSYQRQVTRHFFLTRFFPRCVLTQVWFSFLLFSVSMPGLSFGQQEQQDKITGVRSGGIDFQFATISQARELLGEEDEYLRNLSSFDRQVRMRSEHDPGRQAFRDFVVGEATEWPNQDRTIVAKAISDLSDSWDELGLPDMDTVMLICTTGKEESGAAYTRGRSIVLPRGKAKQSPASLRRLLTHELFHVLSRSNPEWRDQLYDIIGFKPVDVIAFPDSLSDLRITNPDGPRVDHAITVELAANRTATVAPILLAKSAFQAEKTSLFSYLDLKLMEIEINTAGQWVARMEDGRPILHEPSIPDFHRQIGANTKYIIHPDEILADNFVILALDGKAKDAWLIQAMREKLQGGSS